MAPFPDAIREMHAMSRYASKLNLKVFILALIPLLAMGDEFRTPAITAQSLHARQGTPDALLIVDVRPNGEYKSGHVAGAINIPYTKVDKHLDELRKAKGVVLYCTLGHRTKQAEETLLKDDVPNLFHLAGGLGSWQTAGYPLHTGWGP